MKHTIQEIVIYLGLLIFMILVHRLNDQPFWINHRKIEILEKTPDTIIRLDSDHRYTVKESVEEIIDKIQRYEKSIFIVDKNISDEKGLLG